MEITDTIFLLKECNAGTKMAVISIDEILYKVKDEKVKKILQSSKNEHSNIGNEIHTLLKEFHSEDKEPNAMAKGMSWIKTNWKMGMDESDATVADLITEGCNMGIKSLSRYKNQYKTANKKSMDLCNKLIKIEENLVVVLREYL